VENITTPLWDIVKTGMLFLVIRKIFCPTSTLAEMLPVEILNGVPVPPAFKA
jgi:hypothetical protein